MAIAVENLLKKLGELRSYEPNPQTSVELKMMKEAVEPLQPYLQDAEWKRCIHGSRWPDEPATDLYDRVSSWVLRVETLACQADEVLAAYDLHLIKIRTADLHSRFLYRCSLITDKDSLSAQMNHFLLHSYGHRHLFLGENTDSSFSDDEGSELRSLLHAVVKLEHPMASMVAFIKKLLATDAVLVELWKKFSKKMRGEMGKLVQEAPQLQLVKIVFNHSRRPLIPPILEYSSILGREVELGRLEGMVLAEEEPTVNPLVIKVSGERGIGKTMLTAAVYERTRRHFECHAWLFMSNFGSSSTGLLRAMLRGILESMCTTAPTCEAEEEPTLRSMIRSCLDGKRLVLVLDDVSTNKQLECVTSCLPRDCTAKIILTESAHRYSPHVLDCQRCLHLQPLKQEDAFNLLAKRSAETHDQVLSSELRMKAERILQACSGVPLALTTVGGLLSTKQLEIEEWRKVGDLLMEDDDYKQLCYWDLQPALKSCFLCAATSFPLNSEISCKKLQRIWIAEGFAQVLGTSADMTPEEAAKLQLNELLRRNMIQAANMGMEGEVKTCRLHRVMYEFAHQKFRQYKCFGRASAAATSSGFNLSRLLRSFLPFRGAKLRPLFGTPTSSFKRLRVLELQQISGDYLPHSVGDLGQLRYLGLRRTNLKKLPASVWKLQRLQTLDIRETFIRDLPPGFEGLKMLRHLLLAGSFGDKAVKFAGEIGFFRDLQTLAGLEVNQGIAKGLRHLPQLQKLSLGGVKSWHSENLFSSIDHMELLRSLTIKCVFGEAIPMFSTSATPHHCLEKLKIGGQIENLLAWAAKLRTLKCLYLWNSMLKEDPSTALQHLPSLVVLSLCNAYEGEEIQFGREGFAKLKKLSILRCKKLKRWAAVSDEAMGKLQLLTIGHCPKLSSLPKGLEKLKCLQELQVTGMSDFFIKEARDFHCSRLSLRVREVIQLSVQGHIPPAAEMRGGWDTPPTAEMCRVHPMCMNSVCIMNHCV